MCQTERVHQKNKKTLQCSTVHRNGLINNYDCSLELLKTHTIQEEERQRKNYEQWDATRQTWGTLIKSHASNLLKQEESKEDQASSESATHITNPAVS